MKHGKKGEYKEFKKSNIGNTRLYTGREYDSEINLYYLRARYYNPEIGRFISRDTIDISDDVNLYGYVGNNSILYIDLYGLEKQLQNDINNGNSFVIELVARKVQATNFGVHTYIMIYSMDNNLNTTKYSIGGHSIDGKLNGEFNQESDLYWKDEIKDNVILDTPEGIKSKDFVQNLLDEYKDYESNNQKDYRLTGLATPYDTAGNCNNFSTTILYRASNYNEDIVESVSNFNPFGLNPGIGDYFIY